MSFKDHMAADVSGVFLNTSEFADTLDVDGVEMAALLDDTRATDSTMEGVSLYDATLYVATASLDMPVIGQRMSVGGRDATVTGTEENGGILNIRLRWYES